MEVDPRPAHEEERPASAKKAIGKIGIASGRKVGSGENVMVKDGGGAPSGSGVQARLCVLEAMEQCEI